MNKKEIQTRELNLIANKGGSGSVGFKLSIPKPWAAALGVDLNNKTVVASFDGDKIIISGIQNKPQLPTGSGGFSCVLGPGLLPPKTPSWRTSYYNF